MLACISVGLAMAQCRKILVEVSAAARNFEFECRVFGHIFLSRYLLRRLLQHQAMDTSRQQLAPAAPMHLPSQMSSQMPLSQAPVPRQSTQSIAQLLGEVEKRRKKTNRKKKPPAEENAPKG